MCQKRSAGGDDAGCRDEEAEDQLMAEGPVKVMYWGENINPEHPEFFYLNKVGFYLAHVVSHIAVYKAKL